MSSSKILSISDLRYILIMSYCTGYCVVPVIVQQTQQTQQPHKFLWEKPNHAPITVGSNSSNRVYIDTGYATGAGYDNSVQPPTHVSVIGFTTVNYSYPVNGGAGFYYGR